MCTRNREQFWTQKACVRPGRTISAHESRLHHSGNTEGFPGLLPTSPQWVVWLPYTLSPFPVAPRVTRMPGCTSATVVTSAHWPCPHATLCSKCFTCTNNQLMKSSWQSPNRPRSSDKDTEAQRLAHVMMHWWCWSWRQTQVCWLPVPNRVALAAHAVLGLCPCRCPGHPIKPGGTYSPLSSHGEGHGHILVHGLRTLLKMIPICVHVKSYVQLSCISTA